MVVILWVDVMLPSIQMSSQLSVELTIVTPATEVVQDLEVCFEAGGQNSDVAVNEDFNENLESNIVGGLNMAGGNAAVYQALDENLYVMEDSLLMNPTTFFSIF